MEIYQKRGGNLLIKWKDIYQENGDHLNKRTQITDGEESYIAQWLWSGEHLSNKQRDAWRWA